MARPQDHRRGSGPLRHCWLLLLPGLGAAAAERFPQPEFESGYVHPVNSWPAPDGQWLEWLDVALLAGALGLIAWLALRRRSRRGIFFVSLLSVGYFGFFRKGCICPVGSVQPMAEALFGSGVSISLATLALFFLPLVAALCFGRVFCAAACPLGIIQDLVAVRPMKISRWLEETLGLAAYAYLGLGVLAAATGAGYIICRYDPFIPLFRLNGTAPMLFLGGGVLLLGIVIARPYCRFFCPYGVLLRWISRVSWRHLTITPDECVTCRLCEDSCPVEAILPPTPRRPPETVHRGVQRLRCLVLAAPFVVAFGAWLGRGLDAPLSKLNGRVGLHERLLVESREGLPPNPDTAGFRGSGETTEELRREVVSLRRRLARGGAWFGAFFAFIVMMKLGWASVRPLRGGYVPDRGLCISCGKCFLACPREHVRLRDADAAQGE